MRFVSFRLTAVWLQVALLLGAAMTPPGICHSHGGGARPHDHDGDSCLVGEHHDPMASDCGDDHGPLASAMSEGAVAHVHITVFGLPLSWPVDPSSTPPSNRSELIAPIAIAKIAVDDATVGTDHQHLDVLVADSAGCPYHAVPALRVERSEHFTVDRVLLSDTARHERSGVQLI